MAESLEESVVRRLRAAGCVFAEDEARLLLAEAGTAAGLEELLARRVAGEPLEHVLGWAEFCGLRIAVTAGVFVPRHRSEALVEEAAALARPGALVVDLCCGSGALGVAVATAVPGVDLHAADVDPAAVACARGNVARVGGRVYEGDLLEALPGALRGRVDVLVANVPYVPSEEIALMPPEARLHEARVALDGGADGLDVARRVVAAAQSWLTPGGSVLFEVGEDQERAAVATVAATCLHARSVTDDERGAVVVVGTRT